MRANRTGGFKDREVSAFLCQEVAHREPRLPRTDHGDVESIA
jgi:hypothetical protein